MKHNFNNQYMQILKSTVLPIFGLVVLLVFIAMSYFNNHIFLDKIVICSLILGMVFFVKTRGTNESGSSNSEGRKFSSSN